MINIQLKILQMKKAPRRFEGDETAFRRPYDFRRQQYIYIVSYLYIYINKYHDIPSTSIYTIHISWCHKIIDLLQIAWNPSIHFFPIAMKSINFLVFPIYQSGQFSDFDPEFQSPILCGFIMFHSPSPDSQGHVNFVEIQPVSQLPQEEAEKKRLEAEKELQRLQGDEARRWASPVKRLPWCEGRMVTQNKGRI